MNQEFSNTESEKQKHEAEVVSVPITHRDHPDMPHEYDLERDKKLTSSVIEEYERALGAQRQELDTAQAQLLEQLDVSPTGVDVAPKMNAVRVILDNIGRTLRLLDGQRMRLKALVERPSNIVTREAFEAYRAARAASSAPVPEQESEGRIAL